MIDLDKMLPGGVSKDDEIAVIWETSEERTKVKVSLGGATIIVKTHPASAEILPWLISALPAVLETVFEAIDKEEA